MHFQGRNLSPAIQMLVHIRILGKCVKVLGPRAHPKRGLHRCFPQTLWGGSDAGGPWTTPYKSLL